MFYKWQLFKSAGTTPNLSNQRKFSTWGITMELFIPLMRLVGKFSSYVLETNSINIISEKFALKKVLCAIFRRIFTSFQVWWSGPKVWHIKSQMWGEGVKTLSLRRCFPKIVFIGLWSTLSPFLIANMIIMISMVINSTRAPPHHPHHHNHHPVHDHQQNDGQQGSHFIFIGQTWSCVVTA